MPEYQYQCEECDKNFSIVKPMLSNVAAKCPDCGSSKLKRRFSSAPAIYKSGGFYRTDLKERKEMGNYLTDEK